MKRKKIAALLTAAFMTISLVPVAAFAEETNEIEDVAYGDEYEDNNTEQIEETTEASVNEAADIELTKLEGKLGFESPAWVGKELKPDYSKIIPEGTKADMFSFQWSRQTENEIIPVGTEETYLVQQEDLGYRLLLTVTAHEAWGYQGTLSMLTNVVTATEEEAKQNAAAETIELNEFEQFVITPVTPDTQENSETDAAPDTEETLDAEVLQEDENTQNEVTSSETEEPVQETQSTDGTATEDGNFLYQEVEWSELESEDPQRDEMILNGLETDDANSEVITDVTDDSDSENQQIESEKTESDETNPEQPAEPSENPETPEDPEIPEPLEGAPQILGITAAEDINVDYGTTAEDIKALLPAALAMTYRNGTVSPEEQADQTGNVDVNWNDFEYDPTVEAGQTLTITGTADKNSLTDQDGNAIPAESVQDDTLLNVQITVNVGAKPYEVPQLISVTAPEKITVNYGTSADEIKALLPATAKMTYRNGTGSAEEQADQTGTVDVNWNEFSYDPTVEAGQTLTITGIADKYSMTDKDGSPIPAEAVQDESLLNTQITVIVGAKPYEAPKLVAIKAPAAINDLPNGISKDGARFGLPAAVTIVTTKGEMQAQVTWDVAGCTYDQSKVEAQSFTVNGVVTLPKGVEQNNVSLNTSIQVSVKGYQGSRPADNESYISGIAANAEYTTKSLISFKAIGGGMDISKPRKGDYRFLPASWEVLESRHFSDKSYSSSFRIKKEGDYTLTVTYDEQLYNGTSWDKTGNQITRTANFKVVAAEGDDEDEQKKKEEEDAAKKKNSVKTGDESPILPLAAAFVGAGLVIGGVFMKRKLRK
ncbi:MAG: hypothetical protein Q4B47_01860 [Eubacteriales bacterium]|nr:hypothetical protein [Eubacteriales bacterium]